MRSFGNFREGVGGGGSGWGFGVGGFIPHPLSFTDHALVANFYMSFNAKISGFSLQ